MLNPKLLHLGPGRNINVNLISTLPFDIWKRFLKVFILFIKLVEVPKKVDTKLRSFFLF